MECDFHIFLKYLVFRMKNLVFRSKKMIFQVVNVKMRDFVRSEFEIQSISNHISSPGF